MAGVAGVAAGSWALPGSPVSAHGRPGRRTATTTPPVTVARLASGVSVPTAAWVIEENARPGTLGWVVTGHQTPGALEGYASTVSAQAGDEVTLFVNTVADAFHVEAYRMGYYQGLAGRLVFVSDAVPGRRQPAPTFTPGINMVECHWVPSLSFTLGANWPPGAYLLKLVGNGGQQQYVPSPSATTPVTPPTSSRTA